MGSEHAAKKHDALSPLSTIFHVLGEAAHGGHGVAHEHESHGGMIGSGILQSLAGFFEVGHAVGECAEGHGPDCAVGAARGAKDVVQGSAGMFKSGRAAKLGKIAGGVGVGLDAVDAIKSLMQGDYEEAIEHGGAALFGGLLGGEVAPAWHAGQAIGRVISNFGDHHAQESNLYGGGRGYIDYVSDVALDKYGPLYEHLPAPLVHALAAPDVLAQGTRSGLYSAAHGVYAEGEEAAHDVLTGVTAIAKFNATQGLQPVHAPTGQRWDLRDPLAPMRARACYERGDPHAIMQAFGHYAD